MHKNKSMPIDVWEGFYNYAEACERLDAQDASRLDYMKMACKALGNANLKDFTFEDLRNVYERLGERYIDEPFFGPFFDVAKTKILLTVYM